MGIKLMTTPALRAAAALARENAELREQLMDAAKSAGIEKTRADSAESANRALQAEVDRLTAAQPSASDPVGAAYAFVETMISRADAHHGPAPLWYGWALREAYLAGAATIVQDDGPQITKINEQWCQWSQWFKLGQNEPCTITLGTADLEEIRNAPQGTVWRLVRAQD